MLQVQGVHRPVQPDHLPRAAPVHPSTHPAGHRDVVYLGSPIAPKWGEGGGSCGVSVQYTGA
jgi:hypothetical protein